jgi:hypothetical protein
MAGVIGPLLEAAEVGDDGRIANDESRILMSRFPTPFTLVGRCSKKSPKLPFLSFFGMFGAASRREGALGNALQHHETGHDQRSADHSKTECV